MEELMPEASVRWDFLLHSLAITAVLRVRLDSDWWSRSPVVGSRLAWFLKCAFFPLPAGALSPEGAMLEQEGTMWALSSRGGAAVVGWPHRQRAPLTTDEAACAPARSAILLHSSPYLTSASLPIASSSPACAEPLCRVGGACVDSTEHRLWQLQACKLFVCWFNWVIKMCSHVEEMN